jgi:tetratricopeptide (TPR) repeat protein
LEELEMREKTALRCGLFALALACSTALPASPAFAADGTQDFLYLDLQRSVHEDPSSAQNPARFFSLGEYLFQMKSYEQAEAYFKRADAAALPTMAKLLKDVYLAEIARLGERDDSPEADNAREALSKRPYFSLNGKEKKRTWTSALKNRYEFRETVDRMEIYRNGAHFYTIVLA